MKIQTAFGDWTGHLEWLANRADFLLRLKYSDGHSRHGGKLWRKPMIWNIISEVVDLISYVFTLESQLAQIVDMILAKPVELRTEEEVKILSILATGNEDGQSEFEGDADTWYMSGGVPL